jgi:prevent-host-death family protein
MTMVSKSNSVVSKSRFKARALEYFRQVERTGRELVITDRGVPVLKLVPYRADPDAAVRVLRDTVVRYEAPTEPVDPDAWEASR